MFKKDQEKTPELTVVVIAYNNELYIEEALESLDEQTYKDMEVVVVNDSSTDNTGKIIDKFVENRPNFKAIHLSQNSGGCSVPRNTGIDNSSGKYLMFLDGDDWYAKDACEQMVAAIKRTDSDFVAAQAIRTNTYEIWYHSRIYSRERININVREFTELLFDSISVNKIYKRSFLEKHKLRFPEGIHYEDVVFTGKAYFLADSISIIPKPIYYWRVVENAEVKSITNQRNEFNNFKSRIIAHRLLDRFLIENGDSIYLAQKNNKFLRHDLKLYVNDYLTFDDEYKEKFHELIYDYLHEHINKYEFIKLYEELRIQGYLLYIGDKEAFQDYLYYLNGMPTKENRICHNGKFYYFKSDKSDVYDQKFLRISNPSISYDIKDFKLEFNKLYFHGTVNMPSVQDNDTTYYWGLKNNQLNKIIYSTELNNKIFEFNLEGLEPGNYYLTLFVNHRGNLLVRKISGSKIEHIPTIKTENKDQIVSSYINFKDMFGINIAPRSNWKKAVWIVKRRRNKIKSARKRSAFKTRFYSVLKNQIRKLPIKSNWIVFESHMGKQYSDSPKYLYEQLLKSNSNYKYIWSFENPKQAKVTGNPILVKRNSFKHFYYLTRAKYWVDNQGIAHLAPKRKGQVYLQTWHGTPLKIMGYDQKGSRPAELKRLRFQTNAWDYFISPNKYSTQVFRKAFRYNGEILETGYPRNDILIHQPENVINKVREYLGIPEGKKVILFAPTFRDWNKNSYYDTLRDLQILSKKIDRDTIVLLRVHYLLATKVSAMGLPKQIINVSTYPDIQELFLISDILITDYSSVMFDFSVLKRPIILYCYDLEEYLYHRGTYFDIVKHAPGPICRNIDEVINFILNPKTLNDYNEKLLGFNDKFASLEDGNASERVIEKVFKYR